MSSPPLGNSLQQSIENHNNNAQKLTLKKSINLNKFTANWEIPQSHRPHLLKSLPVKIHHPSSGQAPATQVGISAWSKYQVLLEINSGSTKLNCSTVAEAQDLKNTRPKLLKSSLEKKWDLSRHPWSFKDTKHAVSSILVEQAPQD